MGTACRPTGCHHRLVCSVGNIPLAAVLWNGGISFGGVLVFILADLIVLPINNSENHRATAVAIADMWKALGVETRLLATDATSYYAFLREKPRFDVARS